MTTMTHASWCTDHVHDDADPATFIQEHDACQGLILRERGVQVVIEDSEDNGVTVTVFADDVSLTAAQARDMAQALLKAADIVEAAS
ncbi:DUF6360 family protein [Lapillicoccus sp.]|uniref:DUF6360 family protein n=1 Tax=Lapillicoccus sp. TaxID=1909287 RepID=UPI003982E268